MADYTAYPPFVTNAVEPNILLVLDHSGSMQFPAYTGCDFGGYDSKRALCGTSDTTAHPEYNYNSTREYYGYFKTDKYYQYGANKFVENAACSFLPGDTGYKIGNTSGCISGNLLNWATMTRIDILRKVLIGGKSVSQQSNAHTLRAEGGWRKFTDTNLGCVFDITGGSYPLLDHELTIDNAGPAGTCGYLTVWANGSTMSGRSDGFRYVYQSVSGDFDVKLLVVTPPAETGQTYAKAGLEIRATTDRRSQHVMAMATNGAGLQFAYRSTYNGTTSMVGSYVPFSYPVWVRIKRSGNTFTFYYSSDGSTWTTQGSQSVTMPAGVMVGMATSSYANNTLGKAEFNEFICDVCSSDDFNDGTFNASIWSALDINTSRPGNQIESCGGACPLGTLASANIKVDIPEKEKSGVIQAIADKDGDGQFDTGAPRFGLMIYNSDNQGCMKTGIAGAAMPSMLNALQDEPPYNGTPTGEALNEAWDYYTQSNDHAGCNNTAYIGGAGSNKDPWYDSGNPVSCRKSFVLLISDGEWNGTVDPVAPALTTHVNDIRPDMEGKQTLDHFSAYSFGYDPAGVNSMQQIGMYGGFKDYDGNTWPYNRTAYPADSRNATLPSSPCEPASTDPKCKEWDDDGDGLPDNYYQASEGDQLEASLVQAISDILKQSSSGTAVSVLATSGEGEGALYQAYFFPEKMENLESRKWLGYIHAIFVDKYGNQREDTNNNDTLDLTSDLIIELEYSSENGTFVKRYSDSDGDGKKDSDTPVSTGTLDDIKSIWKGGRNLWETPPANRNIFTSTDGNTHLDFVTANSLLLTPYLRSADTTESGNIINWVRGDDLTGITDSGHNNGYRKRSITINAATNVWKLGDIIYSTPSVVGKPIENYDMLYRDVTYYSYFKQYNKRRQVVYVGANDGMLHAFNGGFFSGKEHKFCTGEPDSYGDCTSGNYSLGDELWAFIPRGLLPHLKWLTDPDYTHVYYVDLKPKIADVKVFNADNIHPSGWGTILIGGYRYGGKTISCPAPCSSASPEYFALDITDPLNPRLLWTFTAPDLGLSMSYPSVAKVGDKWFAVFGSGATNFDTASNLTDFQDGNIIVLQISGGSDGVINPWTEYSNFWKIPTGNATAFMADSISVDVDMDYNSDVIYIGENYKQGVNWNALLHRITTSNGTNNTPGSWDLSTLANINNIAADKDKVRKITAAPSAALDDQMNFWIFFGTGQFYGSADKNQTDTGAFYGIKDKCWRGTCVNAYTDLIDASAATVRTDNSVSGVTTCSGGGSANTWSSLINASNNCDGWAIYFDTLGESVDFMGNSLNHSGERVFTKPLIAGGLVSFGAYIPGSNVCSFLGESNAYALYYKTGTAYNSYVFKEQKESASPSDIVARTVNLGEGMPSSPSGQRTIDGTAKVYFQQSTGTIISAEHETPINIKSALKGWKNQQIP
jgi:Tfp pilus tip-associated adhesin PilY1/regulation of enolase protein 1 (concanavalin A-like superfamily)